MLAVSLLFFFILDKTFFSSPWKFCLYLTFWITPEDGIWFLLKPPGEHLLPTLSGKSPRHPFLFASDFRKMLLSPVSLGHDSETMVLWLQAWRRSSVEMNAGARVFWIPLYQNLGILKHHEVDLPYYKWPWDLPRRIWQWVCLDLKAQMQWNAPTPHHVSHTTDWKYWDSWCRQWWKC